MLSRYSAQQISMPMKQHPKNLEYWEEAQHDPLSLPPGNFEELTQDEAVALIREWFFDNFEDPGISTPYETAEGGFQYIWGGPYNTRDVIENIFADTATDDLINAAIEDIEADGSEWVPNLRRRQPPDEYEDLPEGPDALHAEMLSCVGRLEEILSQMPILHGGIGHNNPPEAAEPLPYTQDDTAQLQKAVAVLKLQPIHSVGDGKAAIAAQEIIQTTGIKLKAWLARQGDTFVSEAVKESGKAFGKFGSLAVVIWLTENLFAVSSIVMKWLSSLGVDMPF